MAITILPGQPYPLGATYDGMGTNFSVFSEVAERVELCLFDARRHRDPGRPARERRPLLARLPAQHGPRPALRLPGPRPLPTPTRGCAATRPSSSSTPTPRPSRARSSGASRCSTTGSPTPRHSTQRRRQRPQHAQGGRHQPLLRLGQRPSPPHAVARVGGLRGPRQGLHPAPPRHPRGPAGHLRRPGPPGVDRVPEGARGHRRRAAARCTSSCTTTAWSTPACATTGATTPSPSSPPTTTTRPGARRASRCRSSSRW